MNLLMLFFAIVGAIIACRSLSFAVVQLEMIGYHSASCIKRIVEEQKSVDILVSLYHMAVFLFGLWLIIYAIFSFENYAIGLTLQYVLPLCCIFAFIVFWVFYFYFEKKYHLKAFYNYMVYYRSRQEVVTKDNDDEVDFLRTYRRVKKHIYYAVAWCVLIVVSVLLSI